MRAYNSRSMEHGTADGTDARIPTPADGPGKAARNAANGRAQAHGSGHGAGGGPLSVAEHRDAVRRLLTDRFAARPPAVRTLPLLQARGLVTAADIHAPGSLPPFDNSQMDGYAVRSADLAALRTHEADGRPAATVRLPVGAPVPAGAPAPPLAPGTAVPIMTGAMLPAGADAVVPVEEALPSRFVDAGGEVRLPAHVEAGRFVRTAGSDIAAGTLALPAGTRLGAAQLGLLAALGLAEVPVRARPRVLLLTTGDEVRPPGARLEPGQIHDANTTLLAAALAEAGADVAASRILADAPALFLQRLRADLARVDPDLVVSSGGISKGAYEVVRLALASEGLRFLSVAMQPGGPQGIGSIDGVPFLAFPGNPVSSLVSFEMFLRPALSALPGGPPPRREVRARLAAAAAGPIGRHQVRRGRYADGVVELIGGPGSHLVHALAGSNALVHFPADAGQVPAGAEVAVWLLE